MKAFKLLGLLSVVLATVLMLSAGAFAQSNSSAKYIITDVQLDDDSLSPSGNNFVRNVERNDEVEIEVHIEALEDADDVEISAEISGFDGGGKIVDYTDVFDVRAGVTYVEELNLRLSHRLDQDVYKLRVRVTDRDSDTVEQTYEIEIDADRHEFIIKDVIFTPNDFIQAGRALLTTVRVENIGDVDDDDGTRVTVSIPELGLQSADYIDEVDSDESTSSEELYLRIPSCTAPGSYVVNVDVDFDDGDERVSTTRTINILQDESPLCGGADDEEEEEEDTGKTILTVGPASQDIVAGAGGVLYPLTLSNAGNSAKTYVIAVDGVSTFGSVEVSPSNVVVLQPGESKAVYAFVSASESAIPGQYMFTLTVTSGNDVLQSFPLKATVVAGAEDDSSSTTTTTTTTSWDKVRKGLEIGLVVLVVLLVILGLIIGFSKLKEDEEEGFDEAVEEESSTQTYY